jgi:hypothetical protein
MHYGALLSQRWPSKHVEVATELCVGYPYAVLLACRGRDVPGSTPAARDTEGVMNGAVDTRQRRPLAAAMPK